MPTFRAIVAGIDTTDSSPVVMTSPDATTWTEVSPWPGAAASQVSVAGDSYFVATAAAATANNYAHSGDGDNWTLDTSPPVLQAVVWDNSYFHAISANGAGAYRATTASGTWTGATSTGTSGTFRALATGNAVVVGCLTTGVGNPPIFYSTDGGTSWSTHTPASNAFGVHDVTFARGRFVAVRARTNSSSSDNVLTSTDGASWSVVNVGTNDLFFYRVAYGNGIFVAIGVTNVGTNLRTMTSTNGTSWTVHTPTGLGAISGVPSAAELAYWAGKFILVNPNYGTIWTSTNGQSWSGQTFADRDWRGVSAGRAERGPLGWKVGML